MRRICLLRAVVSLCSGFASEQSGRGHTDDVVVLARTNYSPLKAINRQDSRCLKTPGVGRRYCVVRRM